MAWKRMSKWIDRITGIGDLRNRVAALEEEIVYLDEIRKEQVRQLNYEIARNKLRSVVNKKTLQEQ
jgi:hypothetical protein